MGDEDMDSFKNLMLSMAKSLARWLEREYQTISPYHLDRGDGLLAIGLWVLFFLLYFLTCSRAVNMAGDSPELVGGAYTLGILHPPGYPTYTMMGYLFTHIPLGNIAFRLNMLSATLHAFTLAILYVILLKTTASRVAAAVTTAIIGISPLFWFYSLIAEVFPLNHFFAVLLFMIAINSRESWLEGNRDKAVRKCYLLSFLAGLSLTHHHTILLIFPSVILVAAFPLLHTVRRLKGLFICAGLFVISLLPYAYIPIRASQHPRVDFGTPSSLSSFISHVTRRYYGSTTLWRGPRAAHRIDLLFDYLKNLDKQVYLMGIALALLGAYFMYMKRRGDFWPWSLAFATTGIIFPILANVAIVSSFEISTIERFYIMPTIMLCPFIAMGFAETTRNVQRLLKSLQVRERLKKWVFAVFILLLTMPFYLPFPINLRDVNLRGNTFSEKYIQSTLDPLEDGSLLIVHGDVGAQLIDNYYQTCSQNGRRIITIIWPFWLQEWYMKHLEATYPGLVLPDLLLDEPLLSTRFEYYKAWTIEKLIASNPEVTGFYSMRKLDYLSDEYEQVPFGLVYKITPKGETPDPKRLFAFLESFYRGLDRELVDYERWTENRRELFYSLEIAGYVNEASNYFQIMEFNEEAVRLKELSFNIYPYYMLEYQAAELMEKLGNYDEAAALFADFSDKTPLYHEEVWKALMRREELLWHER